MISFDNLYKVYKNKLGEIVKALDGFSLEIADNEVFALAGVNGAGKTTTLKALFNLINLDNGKIEITTKDSFPNKIGFAPEIPDLPDYLNVSEVLTISCKLVGLKADSQYINEVLEMFELSTKKNFLVSTLSKGNKQRLSLASCVVCNPEIIVFDEPTSGLDPLGRKLIKEVIKQLKSKGHTVLFTTHMLADLPEICDKMAVVHNGKIIFSGTPSDFCKETSLEALENRFSSLVSLEAESDKTDN